MMISPPVNELVASYLGYKAPERESGEEGNLGELVSMFPDGEVT